MLEPKARAAEDQEGQELTRVEARGSLASHSAARRSTTTLSNLGMITGMPVSYAVFTSLSAYRLGAELVDGGSRQRTGPVSIRPRMECPK